MLKDWEKKGKRRVTSAIGTILRAKGAEAELPDLGDLTSILLVRQQNQLGDQILSTPVFRAVRRRAPSARIDLISGPPNHAAVDHNAHLDTVYCYDKKALLRSPAEAKAFLRTLREADYDLVVVMSTVAFSYTSAWLAALSGARRRAGRPGPGGAGVDTAEKVFHWVLPEPIDRRHQSGVNLDLVTPFGAPDDEWAPEIFLTPSELRAGEEALDQALGGAEAGGPRVVIHPGAGKRPNRWPAERFGQVARALREQGCRVAIGTGPSETDLFPRVNEGAGETLPQLPPLPVRAVGAAFRAADFALVNDTGVLHLAAAVGTRTLTLFGPTDPEQWCPAAAHVAYLRAPGGDLEALAPDVVRAAACSWTEAIVGGDDDFRPATPAPTRRPHPRTA